MSGTRQRAVAAVFLALVALAAAVLFDVLATVFFAITVAYVLVPLHRRLVDRGLPPWWASAAATALAFVGVVVVFASFGFLIYRRQAELLAILRELPRSATVELFGFVYTLDASVVVRLSREYLTELALSIARLAPILVLKATLFAMLVFALLIHRGEVRRALLGLVPAAHRDIATAFHERTRQTLFAIYVLQAATALATFLVALPVFLLFDFEFYVTLAIVSGLLQFLPIVGPSFLVVLLAVHRFTVGDATGAVLFAVVASVVVGWLPDAVVRPRLARETAHLPGSLYFVGFTGGLLSLGPVGFIAGPLVVALLVEASRMLTVEVNGHGREEPE